MTTPKLHDRTVKKGGKLKVKGYHWQHNDLIGYVGSWVKVAEPANDQQATIAVTTREGEFIANAQRGARIL
jgi:Mu transposase-like protein